MLSRIAPCLRPVFGGVALLLAVSVVGLTHAQDSLPGNRQEDIEKDLKDPKKGRAIYLKLLRGDEPFDPNNKDQLEALDLGAKYIVYRFAWPGTDKTSGKIDEIYHEFDAQLKIVLNNKNNKQEIANAYAKAMIARARDVINLRSNSGSKPDVVRVNAARVLAKLADLGQPEVADALLDVFNQEIARDADPAGPKRNDGVVYYALHGMRELLAPPQMQPPAIPANLTPERQKKLAETLIAFIGKVPAFSKDTPEEEKDGYRALRREAVRSLVYCRAPGLKDKDRPAMTLLRIMARDGFTPDPHIDECTEAAIGVARLRSTPELDGKDYQPEYAAYQLALFTDYFVKYYRNNIYNPTDKTKLVEQRPYRIYASRMMEALEAMKADTKDPYVAKAVDECRKVLSQVEKGDQPQTLDLEAWLKTNPPPRQSLFQGIPDSIVKPANRP